MNIKKILFWLLFPFLAEVVLSCCECPKVIEYRYTNAALTVINLDNSGQSIVETDSTTVLKTAYGIRGRIFTLNVACLKPHHTFFSSSAFATSCACGPERQFKPKDSIVSIKIYTINDFDNLHSSGSELTDYFKISKDLNYSTVSAFLKNQKYIYDDYEERLTKFDLLLLTAPALGIQHQFRVEIGLSDGRIFSELTLPVDLI